MEPIWLVLLGVLSFTVTFLTLPSWIRRAIKTGFTGKDVHKGHREVAELGGISVILGATVALLFYIALETFFFKGGALNFLLAATLTILIATLIGLVDDVLGWRIGLSQREKVLLTILVPAPMVVVNAGHSAMKFPLLGDVNLGLIYPLLIVSLGIIGAANGFNMLAGFNGLEAGMGMIILSALGFMAWQVGAAPAAVVAVSLVGAIVAFLYYNRYPSKIFPGDVFTYSVGAGIAIVAILGNLERFAAMLFIPYYIEFFLKARGRFNPEWEAQLLDDGSLTNKNRWYSVPHVAISFLRKLKGRAYEYEVVAVIWAFEVVVALFTLRAFFS